MIACLPQWRRKVSVLVVALLVASNAVQAEEGKKTSTNVLPALLLIAPTEKTPIDLQIARSQEKLKESTSPGAELEKLGWLYIAKARASSDPGYFTLAGIAADVLEQKFDLREEAWLLRGHVLQTRHRFAEAEAIGRKLVEARATAADFALLGDALYDEGKIAEAAEAYQRMVDLKPGLDAYARAANIRWIKGDLAGAIRLQTLAVRAGGPRDAGALAWSLCRLGQFLWQQGDAPAARLCAGRALELVPEFAPALLLQGRLLLADNQPAQAIVPLARAAELLPLPEPRWVYAEALRAANRRAEAATVEDRLVREGRVEDPRTVALFLATHGRDTGTAVQLAGMELGVRADVTTRAVNALALARDGKSAEALAQMRAALAEGTADPRLFLYAGHVSAVARQPDAAELLHRASQQSAMLLPSERRLLEESLLLLPTGSGSKDDIQQTTQNKTS